VNNCFNYILFSFMNRKHKVLHIYLPLLASLAVTLGTCSVFSSILGLKNEFIFGSTFYYRSCSQTNRKYVHSFAVKHS
jgi:hypothetical protein